MVELPQLSETLNFVADQGLKVFPSPSISSMVKALKVCLPPMFPAKAQGTGRSGRKGMIFEQKARKLRI